MGDKVEKDVATTQPSESTWSDVASAIWSAGAAGAIAGRIAKAGTDPKMVDAAIGSVIGGAVLGVPGAIAGGVAGYETGMAIEQAQKAKATTDAAKTLAEAAVGAAVGGVGLGAARLIGEAAAKGAIAGAMAGAKAAAPKDTLQKAIDDIKETPQDVKNHFVEHPVLATVETLICPPLVIIESKLAKWFK